MAFGGFTRDGGARPIAEINMVPLIDVMLVLLIIFIITVPLLTHAIKVDLPKAAARAVPQTTETITLDLKVDGALFWNGEAIRDEELATRLAQAAKRAAAPVLHIRADKAVIYEQVAGLMARAQEAGITQIGFVIAPLGKRSVEREQESGRR